jgi:hypothetical protein
MFTIYLTFNTARKLALKLCYYLNIMYYKIQNICLEEVNVANHFSKETVI